MKLISWKYVIYNYLLGTFAAITFFSVAQCNFKAIEFLIQRNSEMDNFYNFLGNNLRILGVFIGSIYFINLYWILKKLSSEKLNESSRLARLKLAPTVYFLYSPKTQKEIFEPIIADWQEEYFEALFKKEFLKARWINVRYTYAFLAAMWQKSPIGDLIEFISKIAK